MDASDGLPQAQLPSNSVSTKRHVYGHSHHLATSQGSSRNGGGMISASSSRMFTGYEISDELTRLQVQHLEKKYGGRLRAHSSAAKIQRAFRHHRLRQQFGRLMSCDPNQGVTDFAPVKTRVFASQPSVSIGPTAKYSLASALSSQQSAQLRRFGNQSQPTLPRFPPCHTSLRAQLRAEANLSPMSSAASTPTGTPSHRPHQPSAVGYANSQAMAAGKVVVDPLRRTRDISPLPKGDGTWAEIGGHCDEKSSTRSSHSNTQPRPPTALNESLEVEESEDGLSSRRNYRRSSSPYTRHIPHAQGYGASSAQLMAGTRFGREGRASPLWLPASNRLSELKYSGSLSINTVNQIAEVDQRKKERPCDRPNMGGEGLGEEESVGGESSRAPPGRMNETVNLYHTSSLPRMDRRHKQVVVAEPQKETAIAGDGEVEKRSSSSIFSTSPTQKHQLMAATNQSQLLPGDNISAATKLDHIRAPSSSSIPSDAHRRRLYRIALNFFNKKPDRGIQLLIAWGFVDANPRSIARLFLERRGLAKQAIGDFLGNVRSPLHAAVLEALLAELSMFDMEIDKALRLVLQHFRLPGEAQKIDHIMQAFAKRYKACNPSAEWACGSTDTVYILSFAIIMLNTDLHSPSLKDSRRMKLEEFIRNLRGIGPDGQRLDDDMLTGIYERIRTSELKGGSDHVSQVMKVDQSIVGRDKPKLVEPHRRLICYCRLNQVVDPSRKQPGNAHQREVFLFNDMILITKLFSTKPPKKASPAGGSTSTASSTTSVTQYSLRYWSPLQGLRIGDFQTALYAHGLAIAFSDGTDELLFNAKNSDDRKRFMADVRESVAESTEMEQLRLELELDRHVGGASGWWLNLQKTPFNRQPPTSTTPTGAGATVVVVRGDSESDLPSQKSEQSGLQHSQQPSTSSSLSAMAPPSTQAHTAGAKNAHVAVQTVVTGGSEKAAREGSSSSGSGSAGSSTGGGGAMVHGAAACPNHNNNNGPAAGGRRLSFNSLDSGMVEEGADVYT